MNPVRLGAVLVTVGLAQVVGAIGIFAYFFYAQDFSPNVNDWGAFGSYLGGVLGASISTLALIGAVIAIYQQHQIDQRTKNHSIAADLMRSIERLEDTIDDSLKSVKIRVHYIGDEYEDTDALNALTGLMEGRLDVVPQYSDDTEVIVNNIMREDLSEKERRYKVRAYELFSATCGRLRFMKDLLENHRALAGNNAAAIYYKKKYKLVVDRLRHAGYPLETWDDISGT